MIIFAGEIMTNTMEIKEYDNESPATMASEPAVAYRPSPTVQATMGRNRSVMVEEYFDKMEKTLGDKTESFEELLDQMEALSTTPPPCQYTVEEAVQRVLQATADVDAGRGLMSHKEFEKTVRSWY